MVAGYVAVTTLVRLMQQRRNQTTAALVEEIEHDQVRKREEAKMAAMKKQAQDDAA